mgnify:CR=1 FL=1
MYTFTYYDDDQALYPIDVHAIGHCSRIYLSFLHTIVLPKCKVINDKGNLWYDISVATASRSKCNKTLVSPFLVAASSKLPGKEMKYEQ